MPIFSIELNGGKKYGGFASQKAARYGLFNSGYTKHVSEGVEIWVNDPHTAKIIPCTLDELVSDPNWDRSMQNFPGWASKVRRDSSHREDPILAQKTGYFDD